MTDILLKEMFLSYSGGIDFNIKKLILADLKTKLDGCDISVKARKRCIYVLEELLSNAHEYYKKRELPSEPIHLFMEQVSDFEVVLQISNTMFKKDAEDTLRKIEEINEGSKEALTQLLHQNLIAASTSEFGSGLGLVSVKLRTGVRYETTLQTKNDEQYIFHLKTLINLSL
jgi:hypothetical protein